jgi:hypothetical protein
MSFSSGTGGILVTEEMHDILKQPGYLSIKKGGQRLRTLYQQRKQRVVFIRFSLKESMSLRERVLRFSSSHPLWPDVLY